MTDSGQPTRDTRTPLQRLLDRYLDTGTVHPAEFGEVATNAGLRPMTRKHGALIAVDQAGDVKMAFVPPPPPRRNT